MAINNGIAPRKGTAAELPDTAEGVAALGFQVATRMAAHNTRQTVDQVLLDLSVKLDCNFNQLKYYHRYTGLPDFMVDWAVSHFRDSYGLRLGRHQLKPTKAVLSAYGIT